MLRTTVVRSAEFMVALWVSHVRALLEYGSRVWNTKYLLDATKLESLERRWTKKIHSMLVMKYVEERRSKGVYSICGSLLIN